MAHRPQRGSLLAAAAMGRGPSAYVVVIVPDAPSHGRWVRQAACLRVACPRVACPE